MVEDGKQFARACCGDGSESEAADSQALQLKALGHPVRLEMIRQLQGRDRCCCRDFCDVLPLAQSTISQHLELLRRAGLVDYEADGVRSRYSLNRTALIALAAAMSALAQESAAPAIMESTHT